ncbi:MAG: thioesterase family protein [Planctomycetaceae bacterium]|nr:thioesterase family protein [Planctomycetaceae bacterium]
MKPTLIPGVTGEAQKRIVTENLVSHHNPRGPAVLATPYLLMIMEWAAYNAIAPHLDEGEDSVGVGFEFQHLAPTPAGATVIASATVTQIAGMMVTLDFEAHDGHEVVGRGTHVRAVLDLARFRRRLERKFGR